MNREIEWKTLNFEFKMDSIVTEKIRENASLNREDDCLHYYELANALFSYINSKKLPISIGIYGKWGSGKSVLVNFMQEICEEDTECEFIKFDAMSFSGDQNNLFWSLMAKIIEKKDKGITGGWTKMVKSCAKVVSTFSENAGTIAKAIGGFLSDEQARSFLVEKTKIFEKDNKKYIVVIDNIDRLTPKAAINFLEKIKVFLLSESGTLLKNFVYLIPCDFEILHAEVREIYRNNSLDARDYLNKLIEVPFYLPQQQDGLIENLADSLMNQDIDIGIRGRVWSVLKQFGLIVPRDIKNFLQELDMIFII
ncbi:MAG: P-loop NTPase fold protein, partial [Candidatus Gracilibacteria bacterium]